MTDEFIPPEPPPGWTVVTGHRRDDATRYGRIVGEGFGQLGRAIARAVGIEGTFIILAAVLGAIGASFIHPAGPWLVVGAVMFVVGLLLARGEARS